METRIVQQEIDAAVQDGLPIGGNDGTDCVLRGDGWYFEHFSLEPGKPGATIRRKSGPFMTLGVPRIIERAYREKWKP